MPGILRANTLPTQAQLAPKKPATPAEGKITHIKLTDLPKEVLWGVSYRSHADTLKLVCKIFNQICNHDSTPKDAIGPLQNRIFVDPAKGIPLTKLVQRFTGIFLRFPNLKHPSADTPKPHTQLAKPSLEHFEQQIGQLAKMNHLFFDQTLQSLEYASCEPCDYHLTLHSLTSEELENLAYYSLFFEAKAKDDPNALKLFEVIFRDYPSIFCENTLENYLLQAAELGDLKLIALLQHKMKELHPNQQEDRALPIHATHHGQVEVLRYLQSTGTILKDVINEQTGENLLHIAAKTNHLQAILFLHRAGLALNSFCGSFRTTPLHFAAFNGRIQAIHLLLELGADTEALDTNEFTPLHTAVTNAQYQSIRDLVALGANLDAEDFMGLTPLHLAAEANDPKLIEILIALGAGMEKSTIFGETPLHFAAMNNSCLAISSLYIQGDAELEAKDNLGNTPLHRAAELGFTDAAHVLQALGGNVEAINDEGKSVFQKAKENNNIDTRQFLSRCLKRLNDTREREKEKAQLQRDWKVFKYALGALALAVIGKFKLS